MNTLRTRSCQQNFSAYVLDQKTATDGDADGVEHVKSFIKHGRLLEGGKGNAVQDRNIASETLSSDIILTIRTQTEA